MTETKTFKAPAMSCGHCVNTIQNEIGELQGVSTVKAELSTKDVTVTWAAPATWEQIYSMMAEIGYPVQN